jgi:predicted amidohydrolase YtcJ
MRITILLLLASSLAFADTAIHNVSGYTSTAAGMQEFKVLLMDDDGRVVATGDESLLKEHPDALRIDGKGRTLLPGLIDAHAHVYGLGFLETSLNLTGISSLDAATVRIAAYARDYPNRRWLLGRGWNQVIWPVKAFPTAANIDAVVSDRPVWLNRIDSHAGWANSKALEIAGIDADTPDPVGGKILRDANGNATGVLIDKAMDLVEAHVPQPTKNDIREAYRQAVADLVSLGLTGVHDAGINQDEAEVYMSMADDGELDMRIYATGSRSPP